MRIEKYTTSSISNVDDEEFYFGSDNDFWFIYNETTDDAFEFWTSDSDGAGLDAELVSIPSGGTTITVNNDLVVGNDLNVQNDLDVDNDLNVDGNAVVDGTVNIAANGLLSGGGADGKMILSNLAADQGVLFDTTTDGQLTLTDESSAALDLRIDGLIFDGAGALNLGTAASTSHSLTTGDVLCGNDLEVDGILYADGGLIGATLQTSQTFIGSNYINSLSYGVTASSKVYTQLYWKLDDGGILAIGNNDGYANRHLIITDYANFSKSHGHDTLSADPTVMIHSVADPTAGDNTQFNEITWNRMALGGGNAGWGCVNQTVAYSDFTDGGGLTGTLVLTEGIPDGAIVQQCILHTLTGFTGGANSTATITVGDGTDVDRYNTGTPDVYTSNASGVDMGAVSGTAWHDDAKNVTLTVTVDNDFSTVSAGSFKIGIYYFCP